jgi:hypothetical protein
MAMTRGQRLSKLPRCTSTGPKSLYRYTEGLLSLPPLVLLLLLHRLPRQTRPAKCHLLLPDHRARLPCPAHTYRRLSSTPRTTLACLGVSRTNRNPTLRRGGRITTRAGLGHARAAGRNGKRPTPFRQRWIPTRPTNRYSATKTLFSMLPCLSSVRENLELSPLTPASRNCLYLRFSSSGRGILT